MFQASRYCVQLQQSSAACAPYFRGASLGRKTLPLLSIMPTSCIHRINGKVLHMFVRPPPWKRTSASILRRTCVCVPGPSLFPTRLLVRTLLHAPYTSMVSCHAMTLAGQHRRVDSCEGATPRSCASERGLFTDG